MSSDDIIKRQINANNILPPINPNKNPSEQNIKLPNENINTNISLNNVDPQAKSNKEKEEFPQENKEIPPKINNEIEEPQKNQSIINSVNNNLNMINNIQNNSNLNNAIITNNANVNKSISENSINKSKMVNPNPDENPNESNDDINKINNNNNNVNNINNNEDINNNNVNNINNNEDINRNENKNNELNSINLNNQQSLITLVPSIKNPINSNLNHLNNQSSNIYTSYSQDTYHNLQKTKSLPVISEKLNRMNRYKKLKLIKSQNNNKDNTDAITINKIKEFKINLKNLEIQLEKINNENKLLQDDINSKSKTENEVEFNILKNKLKNLKINKEILLQKIEENKLVLSEYIQKEEQYEGIDKEKKALKYKKFMDSVDNNNQDNEEMNKIIKNCEAIRERMHKNLVENMNKKERLYNDLERQEKEKKNELLRQKKIEEIEMIKKRKNFSDEIAKKFQSYSKEKLNNNKYFYIENNKNYIIKENNIIRQENLKRKKIMQVDYRELDEFTKKCNEIQQKKQLETIDKTKKLKNSWSQRCKMLPNYDNPINKIIQDEEYNNKKEERLKCEKLKEYKINSIQYAKNIPQPKIKKNRNFILQPSNSNNIILPNIMDNIDKNKNKSKILLDKQIDIEPENTMKEITDLNDKKKEINNDINEKINMNNNELTKNINDNNPPNKIDEELNNVNNFPEDDYNNINKNNLIISSPIKTNEFVKIDEYTNNKDKNGFEVYAKKADNSIDIHNQKQSKLFSKNSIDNNLNLPINLKKNQDKHRNSINDEMSLNSQMKEKIANAVPLEKLYIDGYSSCDVTVLQKQNKNQKLNNNNSNNILIKQKPKDYLREERVKRDLKNKSNLDFRHSNNTNKAIEDLLNDKKCPFETKVWAAKNKLEVLENKTKQKEQLLRTKGGMINNLQIGKELCDVITDTIQAKLNIMNNIMNEINNNKH